jgi:hypothetical protein
VIPDIRSMRATVSGWAAPSTPRPSINAKPTGVAERTSSARPPSNNQLKLSAAGFSRAGGRARHGAW